MADRNALEADAIIAGYKVQQEARRDSYGITYSVVSADDEDKSGKAFFLRECYPAGLAKREAGHKSIMPDGEFAARPLKILIDLTERSVSRYGSLRTWGFVPEREYFFENNTIYQVWDMPSGKSLADALREGERFTQADLKDALNTCLTALNRLHGWGFVHAALTPDDIFSLPEGELEMNVPELGLAERARRASGGDLPEFSAYAAPEQVKPGGGEIDFKADLYSLAASFYYLLTSKEPASAAERLAAQEQGGKDPLDLQALKATLADKSFYEVMVSALSLDPAKRPFSATVFSTLLTGGAGGRPLSLGSTIREPKKSGLPKILGGVAALAVLGVAGWFGYTQFIAGDDTEAVSARSEVEGFNQPVVATQAATEEENDSEQPAAQLDIDVPAIEAGEAGASEAETPTEADPATPSPVVQPVPQSTPSARPSFTPTANMTTEEAAWAKASAEDTWWSYRVYLQSFGPNSAQPGAHAADAQRLYLERGDERAANVRTARQLLGQLGYNTPAGDAMDAELARQIAEFQRQNDLAVNGDATADLVAALQSAVAAQ